MGNKGIGAVFCMISALLISAKYLAAAILATNTNILDRSVFLEALDAVGPFLTIASFLALVVGILFSGYGIYQDIKQ